MSDTGDLHSANDLPSRLPDAVARRILDRAIEIDAERRTHTSLDSVRSVARELGVSDESVEVAIRECLRDASGSQPGHRRHNDTDATGIAGEVSDHWAFRASNWLRRGARVAIPLGLACGLMTAFFANAGMDRAQGFTLIGLTAIALAAIAAARPARVKFRDGLALAAIFWGFFAFGVTPFLFPRGDFTEVLVISGAAFLGGSIIFGGAIELYLRLFRPRADEEEPLPAR